MLLLYYTEYQVYSSINTSREDSTACRECRTTSREHSAAWDILQYEVPGSHLQGGEEWRYSFS